MSKYRAKPMTIDGIRFDSQREAARYGELRLLQRGGKIMGLTCHPAYELAPSIKFAGAKRTKPALRYVADFRYYEGWPLATVVEDVKSPATAKLAAFVIKRHLMLSIHKIDVRIIT